MSVVRAFIALDFPPEIYQRLEEVENELKRRIPEGVVRWVPAYNVHLTLKFLGDVSLANVEVLKKTLQAEARSKPAFDLRISDLGAFPSIHRPRVIWVGVQAPTALAALQRGIENETYRLGYMMEERQFAPHLTLGRVSRNASAQDARAIGQALTEYQPGLLGDVHILKVHLYRSDLRPTGAVYSKLDSAALRPDTPARERIKRSQD
jgi:RNA 2',3'-cyclic 3'-phosphodiesterase